MASLMKSLQAFVAGLARNETPAKPYEEDDHRLAAAALLFHAIAIDGVVEESERETLKDVLKKRFSLSDAETETLIKEARQRDLESVDLHSFTSVLNRTLDDDGRRRIIEMLWETVYADGTVHEFEDNMVWRVAELLGVSTRDRMLLKKKVSSGLNAGEPDAGSSDKEGDA